MDSRLGIRRLEGNGEGASQLPDTMRVSASQTSLARTSFEEIAWLSRVNAGSHAQIFLALSKERDTRHPQRHLYKNSKHNLVFFRSGACLSTRGP